MVAATGPPQPHGVGGPPPHAPRHVELTGCLPQTRPTDKRNHGVLDTRSAATALQPHRRRRADDHPCTGQTGQHPPGRRQERLGRDNREGPAPRHTGEEDAVEALH